MAASIAVNHFCRNIPKFTKMRALPSMLSPLRDMHTTPRNSLRESMNSLTWSLSFGSKRCIPLLALKTISRFASSILAF